MNDRDEPHIIQSGEDVYACRVDPLLLPQLTRMLAGSTPIDREVDTLAILPRPIWLNVIIRSLRWYRSRLSRRLGHRCVYEPSCSRYSELSFRKYGLWRGFALTAKRLWRCRPGYGGIDLP
jgi:putative membrane protein insertion efficiency factor